MIAQRLLILIFIGTSLITEAKAQNKNDFSILTGITNHKVKDQTISPMIYRGTTIPIYLECNLRMEKYKHRLSVNFDKLELNSNISNIDKNNIHTMDNINLHIEYSADRKIISNLNHTHSLGMKFSTFMNYRDLEIHKSGSGMTMTLDHANSISLAYNLDFRNIPILIDKIDFYLSTPFVSYILLEGTYNANVNEDFFYLNTDENLICQIYKTGSFVSFDKYFQIISILALTKSINKRFSTKLSYYFNFYSFDKYEKILEVNSLNNSILIGLTYNFGKNEN